MYFPDMGCVHTLLTLYVYATGCERGEQTQESTEFNEYETRRL